MEAAARIAPGIICLMQQTRDEFLIESVSESMHVLVDKLTAQDVQATFHQIVFALEQTSTDSALRCLAQSLSTLTERLPAV